MDQIFQKIDQLIEKIPGHIKDIIQKAAIALAAIITLVSVTLAAVKGIQDADPGGFQLIKNSDDVFYLKMLKDKNSRRVQLIEDIDSDIDSLTQKDLANKNIYKSLARETLDHLIGEQERLLSAPNELRNSKEVLPFIKDRTISPGNVSAQEQKNKRSDGLTFPSVFTEKNFLRDDTPLNNEKAIPKPLKEKKEER